MPFHETYIWYKTMDISRKLIPINNDNSCCSPCFANTHQHSPLTVCLCIFKLSCWCRSNMQRCSQGTELQVCYVVGQEFLGSCNKVLLHRLSVSEESRQANKNVLGRTGCTLRDQSGSTGSVLVSVDLSNTC